MPNRNKYPVARPAQEGEFRRDRCRRCRLAEPGTEALKRVQVRRRDNRREHAAAIAHRADSDIEFWFGRPAWHRKAWDVCWPAERHLLAPSDPEQLAAPAAP